MQYLLDLRLELSDAIDPVGDALRGDGASLHAAAARVLEHLASREQ